MSMAKGLAVVQQAIFTSAKTDRSAGYQILAASPGIAEFDRRELAAWGPSHDSLLDSGPDAVSVNFFPLPSGSFCVSRTTPAGWEYSGRGGHRIYTHCLIASPEVLRQFANHPLLLLGAAMAGGSLEPLDAIPARLEPLELRETTTAGDAGRLAQLAAEVGPASLAMLVQAALTNVCLAVRGPVATDRLIGGLLDCLPRRLPDVDQLFHGTEVLRAAAFRSVCPARRRGPATVACPSTGPDRAGPRPQPGFGQAPGQRLGAADPSPALVGKLRLPERRTGQAAGRFHLGRPACPGAAIARRVRGRRDAATRRSSRPASPTRPIASSRRVSPRPSKSDASVTCAPSELLDADSPEVVARLEALDDAVFDAIQGKAAALADLHQLWPALKSELGDALLAESREQYIRYALSIWQEPANIEGDHDPARAVNALEVLCVLFDEVR